MFLSACGSNGDLYQIEEPEITQKITEKEPRQSIEEQKKKPR